MDTKYKSRKRRSPPEVLRLTAQESLKKTSGLEARKRIAKACDRCRTKKIKCDGSFPCKRCDLDDSVCYFGSRVKVDDQPVSATIVRQLQLQNHLLTEALRVLWGRAAAGGQGEPNVSEDELSVHAIVERTGVLEEARRSPAMLAGHDLDKIFSSSELQGLTTEPDSDQCLSSASTWPFISINDSVDEDPYFMFGDSSDFMSSESERIKNSLMCDLDGIGERSHRVGIPEADLKATTPGENQVALRRNSYSPDFQTQDGREPSRIFAPLASQQLPLTLSQQTSIPFPGTDMFEEWTTLGNMHHVSDRTFL